MRPEADLVWISGEVLSVDDGHPEWVSFIVRLDESTPKAVRCVWRRWPRSPGRRDEPRPPLKGDEVDVVGTARWDIDVQFFYVDVTALEIRRAPTGP